MPTRDNHANWQPLSRERLKHYEERLLEERKRAQEELGHNTSLFDSASADSDGELSDYPLHMADQGTDAMEQEKSFLLASQEGRQLWQIDEALRHLYREPETFGRCSNCGRAISPERLEALPYTQLCMDCAQSASAPDRLPASPTGDR